MRHQYLVEEVYRAAAAVELMILSLDIFDDLQDQDNLLMPWKQIEPAIAMNIATGLLILATKMLRDTTFNEKNKMLANDYLSSSVLAAVNGQHMDLSNSMNSENDIIEMMRKKSGSLLSAACLVGTALATDKYHNIIKNYAEQLGIAAQIQNDMKDLFRWNEKGDIYRRKKTLPILYILRHQQPEFQMMRDYYAGQIEFDTLLKHKRELESAMKSSGLFQYSEVIRRVYERKAQEQISVLNISEEWKNNLWKIINYPQ